MGVAFDAIARLNLNCTIQTRGEEVTEVTTEWRGNRYRLALGLRVYRVGFMHIGDGKKLSSLYSKSDSFDSNLTLTACLETLARLILAGMAWMATEKSMGVIVDAEDASSSA